VITWKIPLQGKIPQGVVKTNFSATIGSAMTEPVEAGLITVSLDRTQVRWSSIPSIVRVNLPRGLFTLRRSAIIDS
jgi:hypothetical protein